MINSYLTFAECREIQRKVVRIIHAQQPDKVENRRVANLSYKLLQTKNPTTSQHEPLLDLCLVNTRHRVQKKANAPQAQGSDTKALRIRKELAI